MTSSINDIYQELRENFIVIGLTGSVGSGCTTSSDILSNDGKDLEETLRHAKEDLGHNCLNDSFENKRVERIRNFYPITNGRNSIPFRYQI